MEFTTGDTVVISVYKKLQVGNVTAVAYLKSGRVYIVQTEDTKIHEGVRVDSPDDESYIVSHLTKAFQNK